MLVHVVGFLEALDHPDGLVTDLDQEDYDEYYNGFANRVLWPILHYRLDLAEFSRRDLSGYRRVNAHFANQLHELIEPDDVIWVHDYHLMLLPGMLREKLQANRGRALDLFTAGDVDRASTLASHALLIGFCALFFLIRGGGVWSLDRAIGREL